MTQEELGKQVGVTGVTIMRYEKGLREPSLEQLEKLSDALHVTPSYLVGWENTQLIGLLCQSLGVSQENLSRKTGIAVSELEKYETGAQEMRSETLSRILDALGAPENETSPIRQQAQAVEEEIDQIKASTRQEETELLALLLLTGYAKLNRRGQHIAVERLEELAKIPDYQNGSFPEGVELPEALLNYLGDSSGL